MQLRTSNKSANKEVMIIIQLMLSRLMVVSEVLDYYICVTSVVSVVVVKHLMAYLLVQSLVIVASHQAT
jgi:hypothetical protein